MSLVLKVDILGDYKKLSNATKGAQSNLSKFSSKVADIGKKAALTAGVALAGVGAAVVSQIKPTIDAASDLQESLNAINVAFGENAAALKVIGESAAKDLGLSQKDFNDIAVRFSAFAKTIAGEGGDVVGVIDSIATRGADFASVFNLDVTEALTKFQSGLSGETEPLRRFGIDVSAAKVEQYALANGLIESKDQLTEQVKVMARYGTIMEQTAMVQGDFQNTSDGLANSSRIVTARIENLRAKIGSALLPTMEKLTGWILDNAIPAMEDFWAEITTPGTEANDSIVRLKDAWRDFSTAFTGDANGIKATDIFVWITDGITNAMRELVRLQTFLTEVIEGFKMWGTGDVLTANKGWDRMFNAINTANVAANAFGKPGQAATPGGITVPKSSMPMGGQAYNPASQTVININRANLAPEDVVTALQRAQAAGIRVR